MRQSILETPIEYLKGVGPKRAQLFRDELHISTFMELLQYFPFRYIDKSKIHKISEINNEMSYVQLKGKISNVKVIGAKRAQRLSVILNDESGAIELLWFKGIKWFKDSFKANQEYLVFGKPSLFNSKFNMPHPDIEIFSDKQENIVNTLQGFYSATEKLNNKGLGSKNISKLIWTLVNQIKDDIQETLPEYIKEMLKLVSRKEALVNIHFPKSQSDLQKAQSRLKFEELFYIQLRLLQFKKERNLSIAGHSFKLVGDYFNNFYNNNLSFELTNAQKRVIKEIRADVGSGRQMNRLLQGDVGSGKTMVALMSALIAIDNGYQACFMAPTEILANQHFNSVSTLLEGLNLNVGLLTGSTKARERRVLFEELEQGNLHLLIGTHALIEKNVIFRNLGLVVIDEQHRFGVEQRAQLWRKNTIPPHVLVMTATPIPRTLAMTLYGDLDISIIDELPPGRKSIKTYHFFDSKRLKVFGFMKDQIKQGRQIYIVYPLIKESEKLDLKDLIDGYESIQRTFPLPEYAISIVHGQMKSADKDYEMQRFINKETQIMVATTVIEVGVDIPNASVMIIESAERFGLSQLHQLRGRVGRGADQSYCILMSDYKLSSEARTRLGTMVATNDGFEISEADLRLRGPGDMQGTQQSGIIDLKIASIVKDEKILKYARNLASEILDKDPGLQTIENKLLYQQLKYINKSKPNWSAIS